MGGKRFDQDDWKQYQSTHVAGKSQAQVFTARSLDPALDPAKIKYRESCNSPANPNATGVIIASDITGSMGFIAHELIKTGIPTVANEIYKRKPIPDPHIMVMAIGDAKTDEAPCQISQFEAGATELASQLRAVWLEGHGGGNNGESYSLAHLAAAMKTKLDCTQAGRRGMLFTIGDEPVHDGVTREEAERVLGIKLERDLTAKECVALASRTYEIFHIVLKNEGYAADGGLPRVLETWKAILPERTILLDDYKALAQTIVSAIQVVAGETHEAVAGSWSGNTALVVANAIKDLAVRGGTARGVTRLT